MIRIILVFVAVVTAVWLVRWFLNTPPAQVAARIKKSLIYIIVGLLILLAATGRLNWMIPVLGAFFAVIFRSLPHLLRYAPLLHRLWTQMGARSPSSSNTPPYQSTVEARFVRMRLDHQTGEIDGEVLEGQFTGKHLHELSVQQVIQLYQECKGCDEESVSLVEAYLDRVHGPDWRDISGGKANENRSTQEERGPMNQDEAYQILGLQAGASEQEIKDAHRRLIQKFHPDRGGSDYLAAKINKAKDMLLG